MDITRTLASPLDPRSVAVVGASDNPNKVGGRPIHYMQRFGFRGRILAINPGRSTVQGLRCYASLDALDETPDAAIIAVAGHAAIEAVRDCARRGVATAIVMASGFAETGAAGRRMQEEMVAYAGANGMRVVGPNAQGIANFATGAVMNFSTMFMEIAPQDGPIAIVSQSGAASVMPYALLRGAGMGVRYLVATGNDSDLGVSELARTVARDPDIRLILVYVEAVTKPEFLAEAAYIARQRGAGIVLLRGGSSQKGAAAAASHTGAMVGKEGALDAFLQRHGIWRARDMHELVNAAPLYLSGFPAGAGRTVIMSHSGAVGVMCADAAERVGLPLVEFSDATRTELLKILPDFASAENPLDLTAALLGNVDMFPRVIDAIAADAQADMFVVGIPVAGPGYDVPAMADATATFARQRRKPVVVTAPQESVRQEFHRRGVPTFIGESDAIRALHQYYAHNRIPVAESLPLPQPASASTWFGLLDEARSLELLRAHGVPVVEQIVCKSVDAAVRAAQAIGGKVAVKGCAAQLPHKSDHGLVHLNLLGMAEVEYAAKDCLGKMQNLGVSDGTVLVGRMVRGVHEFMLGAAVDPIFGPIVMIGDGGTLVEMRHDVVSLLAPFSADMALATIAQLRIAPVLAGFRGQPALDAQALASAAVALGNFAVRYRTTLVSVDLNPVMVMPQGHGVVAVDAVVEFKGAE